MTVYKGCTVTTLLSPCPFRLYYLPQKNGVGDDVVQQLLKPIRWVVQHGKLLVALLSGGGQEFYLLLLILYAVAIIL